jgi:hypothetical protein
MNYDNHVLTGDEMDDLARLATIDLPTPGDAEVINTGGGIWLVEVNPRPDISLNIGEEMHGDGQRFSWTVNRLDDEGDFIDCLAEGCANTWLEAKPAIVKAIEVAW